MCEGGECLSERDWACGYENGDTGDVWECFSQSLTRLPVWCGHRHMVFLVPVGTKTVAQHSVDRGYQVSGRNTRRFTRTAGFRFSRTIRI
jgi:hypothetical protein